MKLNRKGFTLVEVISVVVILGILVVISFPIVTGVFESSEEKSEKIFIEEVSRIIDGYVSLEGIKLQYIYAGEKEKCDNDDPNSCYKVNTYKNQVPITFQNIITSGLMAENDLINPNDKVPCNANKTVEIYRDSEYVYCYKAKLDCVGSDDEFDIDTCEG